MTEWPGQYTAHQLERNLAQSVQPSNRQVSAQE
jgi:hypothetical protein